MAPWRHTAASAVAASAVLFTGQTTPATATTVTVTQDARQGFRAAARIAAQSYRQQRRQILARYREATRAAHHRLRTAMLAAQSPEERDAAWRAYSEQTAPLRASAHLEMQAARGQFRDAVDSARQQFGVPPSPRTVHVLR